MLAIAGDALTLIQFLGSAQIFEEILLSILNKRVELHSY